MNGTFSVNVNVNVDKNFVEALAMLASAIGHPATIGNEAARTAKEMKEAKEAMEAKEAKEAMEAKEAKEAKESPEPAEPASGELDSDAIRRLAFEVSEKRGKDAVRKALAGFALEDGSPVPKITMLPKKDYAAFVKRLKEDL